MRVVRRAAVVRQPIRHPRVAERMHCDLPRPSAAPWEDVRATVQQIFREAARAHRSGT